MDGYRVMMMIVDDSMVTTNDVGSRVVMNDN